MKPGLTRGYSPPQSVDDALVVLVIWPDHARLSLIMEPEQGPALHYVCLFGVHVIVRAEAKFSWMPSRPRLDPGQHGAPSTTSGPLHELRKHRDLQ